MRKAVEMLVAMLVVVLVAISAAGGTQDWATSGGFTNGVASCTNSHETVIFSGGTSTWNSVEVPRVYFSPNYDGPGNDCISNLVAEIGKAKSDIRVAAYQFTSQPIADALVRAAKRGVAVGMIVDPSCMNTRNSKVGLCLSNGVSVAVDSKHSIFHNKTMVIDKKTVVTGSFNFTANAEYHNAENMWIMVNTNAASMCVSNWMVHASHSEVLLLK